jgi:hypothetical protein
MALHFSLVRLTSESRLLSHDDTTPVTLPGRIRNDTGSCEHSHRANTCTYIGVTPTDLPRLEAPVVAAELRRLPLALRSLRDREDDTSRANLRVQEATEPVEVRRTVAGSEGDDPRLRFRLGEYICVMNRERVECSLRRVICLQVTRYKLSSNVERLRYVLRPARGTTGTPCPTYGSSSQGSLRG